MAFFSKHRMWPHVAGLALILLVGLSGMLAFGDEEEHGHGRADLILIDVMKSSVDLERPPVQFKHDAHVEAVGQSGKDCSTCHKQQENGLLSQKFMRLWKSKGAELMELYHEGCIGCHQKFRDEGKESGPITCGDCHRAEPEYTSTRQPVGFDKSLHYSHIQAMENQCDRCHHEGSDSAADAKPSYVKGHESSCRECHQNEESNTPHGRSSFRKVAHEQCLGCHRNMSLGNQKTGPTNCAGCHDAKEQANCKEIDNPPRLQRGQPDVVVVRSTYGEEQPKQAKLKAVPFNHKGHENYTDSCRGCHHNSMNACGDCHTMTGTKRGGGVNLEDAMHTLTKGASCLGCHEDVKMTEQNCAGCHSLMPKEKYAKNACVRCHNQNGEKMAEAEAESSDGDTAETQQVPQTFQQVSGFDPQQHTLSFNKEDLPDEVKISSLQNLYRPVNFAHDNHVDKLLEGIRRSPMALYFHGGEDALCQGCHHNTPVGEKPPLCSNCHGAPFDDEDIHRPGLKGAYHLMCMGCHKSMKVEKAQGCQDCHIKKKL